MTDRKACFGTTTRTNLNTTFAYSQSNRLQVPTSHPDRQTRKSRNENSQILSFQSTSRLEGILNRLKEVNGTSQLEEKADKGGLNA
jgi:hypothetical protein